MKIFRRTAALMLCAAMIFSAGCSEKTTMSSQKAQVEIEFSWWGNDARNRYTLKAVELFEELHPEIRVKCSYSEWSGYENRNKIWMASDTEADVMQINYGWLTDYSADGMGYYDLNALSKYIDLSNFTEEQLSYGTRNGVLNALPIAMNSEMVYINKTIYDRYGADVPKTWDDLFRAADAMRSANIYPLSASSKSMWLYLISYAEQAQGKSILDQSGSLNFTEKDFAVMMDFYKKLVDSKVMPLVEHYERIKLDNENYAGSVAWVSDAESYFGESVSKEREIVVADQTTISGNNTGEGWYAKPATMYAVSKNTDRPAEAGMLLDFLLNSREMAELQGIEKGIPLSASAREVLNEQGMLQGIQFEASEKMAEHTLPQLLPVLENGRLIDDFFAAATDYIYEKSDLDSTASSFIEKAKKEYF
ncbi:ABC transporter substrate-binding protein [Ruminococcus sp.]|uniref:ABC transporter substrate-binding protein n=1 Tax=Ruminococcus sp. TaxID=41978 RepID=UPI0025F04123|nr:ABC transporter substrate-binding protein [Ruminococcus sp.]MCR4639887.1 ABC transporter substrate-binding protein [Ruminococcus sp.]